MPNETNEARKESILMRVLFWLFVASSISSLLHLDDFRLGMFLTYSPRISWLLIAVVFLFSFIRRKNYSRMLITCVCVGLLLYDTPIVGWSNSDSDHGEEVLTLLSFNIANEIDHANEISKICEEMEVDLLSLQEVSPANRSKLLETMVGYEFFHSDDSAVFEYAEPRVFSSLVGIRKGLIENREAVRVATGITGYRMLAVEMELISGQAIQMVNVHSTKPFTIYYGISKVFSNAAQKASRHRNEKDRLEAWLADIPHVPTIVAGDFNAPANSYNLRFENLTHTHRQAGVGPHLTFPRQFPFIGIDHVWVSKGIEALSNKVIDAGFSDHRAQLTRFKFD